MTHSSVSIHKSKGRSRLTNNAGLLPTTDGRSVWARIMRDTLAAMLNRLGGANRASAAQCMAARRIAAFEAELIFLEDKFARVRSDGSAPDAADLDLYNRLSNGQRRHLEALGWHRIARDVTPTLQQYTDAQEVDAA